MQPVCNQAEQHMLLSKRVYPRNIASLHVFTGKHCTAFSPVPLLSFLMAGLLDVDKGLQTAPGESLSLQPFGGPVTQACSCPS